MHALLSTLLMLALTGSLAIVRGADSAFATITTAPSLPTGKILADAAPANQPLPLTQYNFNYPNLPYQVNPYVYLRGPQTGYNLCNSTTAGPSSMCQTGLVNSISDFCLWGSPGIVPTDTIGQIEAAVVAYCSDAKNPHGARLIGPGMITGVQVCHFRRLVFWSDND